MVNANCSTVDLAGPCVMGVIFTGRGVLLPSMYEKIILFPIFGMYPIISLRVL